MFDKQMQVNNVQYDGKILQYEQLSALAERDLPKAVELMSKLTIEGKIGSQVLQKLFTARHVKDIQNLLISVNGNVGEFVNGITKGIYYTDDFSKNMFNINNQLKQLKNNLFATFGAPLDYATDSITGVMMMINKLNISLSNKIGGTSTELKDMKSGFGALIGELSGLATVTATTYLTLSTFLKLVKTLGGTLTSVGKVGILPALGITVGSGGTVAIISSVIASIYAIGRAITQHKKRLFDVDDTFLHLDTNINKLKKSFKDFDSNLTFTKNQLNELKNIDFSEDYAKSLPLLDKLLGKYQDFMIAKESMENWKGINLEQYNKSIGQLHFEADKYRHQFELLEFQLEKTQKSMVNNITDTIKEDEGYKQRVRELLNYYIDLSKTIKDTNILDEKFKAKAKELSIGSGTADTWKKRLSIEEIQKDLDKMEELSKKAQDIDKKLKNFQSSEGKQITANLEAYNKNFAYLLDLRTTLLKETGQFEIDGKIYSEFDGIIKLFESSKLEDLIDKKKKYINDFEEFKREKGSSIYTLDDLKKYDNFESNIKESDSLINTFKANSGLNENSKEYAKNIFDGMMFTEKTSEWALKLLDTQYDLNMAKALEPDQTEKIDILQERYNLIKGILESIDAKAKEREKRQKSEQTYQIKYNNYLKESLNLEKELEKINNSKGMQDAIEFKYKIKQLNLDQSILEKEKEQHKLALKRLQVTKELEGYKNIVLNANDSKTMQSVIDSLYERYKGELEGDNGKAIKDFFETVKQYTQTTSKSENLIKQEELEKIKKFREELESIPEAFVNSRKALIDISNMNFMDRNGRFEDYIQSLQNKFNDSKNKIYQSYAINSDLSIGKALEDSLSEIDFVKTLKNDTNLSDIKQELVKVFGEDFMKMFDEQYYSKEKGNYVDEATIILIDIILKKNQDLIKLNQEQLNQKTEELKKQQAIADAYAKTANFMGKLSNITGIEAIGKLGDIVSATGEMTDFLSNPENSFSLKDIFTPQDTKEWADNLSKAMESAFKGMEMGTAVGGLVGNFIGGSQGASMAGGLAGMVTGAMGMTGWGALGIQAGASILGGLLDSSEKDKAEAERRTKEANKIYNKNTEALQKLSQNMTSLNGGVDGLNNTLISYFSKIPTIDNINNVTSAMKNMYTTMEKTRLFNDVAYQVTKTKKKKGFLGIGGSSTSWTETIEVSVQEMLNRYGFEGAIEDMTSQQLRDFSKWLDDYDLGDSDNFGILADALENYAEALDKFDKNIDNFFRDTTMEAFEGISSLQQEDLRQQIEEFYKNLGLQIDEETSKQIDKLAEEMSVMVTIMTDVRSEFINSWRSSGMDAGKAFLNSMTPYIDAMLNNIAQIYYDVYFSGVNEILEKEFKALSEKLVELKKQGKDLEWDNIAKELQGSFEHILGTIQSVEDETESFNNILLQLQKQAMDSGLSLSEIFQLGLTTDTQKSVIEAFKSSIGSGEMNSGLKAIGDLMGDKVGEALVNKMIDNMFGEKILQLSAQIDKAMSGNLGFGDLAGLANEALGVGMMLESERLRLEAIKDMFSFDSDISYNTDESVNYSSGTSQSITNIYNISSNVEAGNVIESDSIERLADELLDTMLEKLRIDKGITLK